MTKAQYGDVYRTRGTSANWFLRIYVIGNVFKTLESLYLEAREGVEIWLRSESGSKEGQDPGCPDTVRVVSPPLSHGSITTGLFRTSEIPGQLDS